MTWEETIKFIRGRSEYSEIVYSSYLSEDLKFNVQQFRTSEEYLKTLEIISMSAPDARTILDVGSGNGISAISFALDGFSVTAVEPDPSDSVGAGAIKILKDKFALQNIDILEKYAEDIIVGKVYDVIYARQSMHHAYDLRSFVNNLSRFLKKDGLFITIRDHLIFDAKDKEVFLASHPLQRFYGGENAFTLSEYLNAFHEANLSVKKIIKYFESVINYFPISTENILNCEKNMDIEFRRQLERKIGFFSKIEFLVSLYKLKNNFKAKAKLDESHYPCRMYSFVSVKK